MCKFARVRFTGLQIYFVIEEWSTAHPSDWAVNYLSVPILAGAKSGRTSAPFSVSHTNRGSRSESRILSLHWLVQRLSEMLA